MRAGEREGERQHRVPGGGHVDVHDALHVAHVRLARCVEQAPVRAPDEQREPERRDDERPATVSHDGIPQSSTTRSNSETAERPVDRRRTPTSSSHPGAELPHGIAEDQERRGLDRGEQHRHHQREKQERQQGLAGSHLRGHGRVQGSGRREPGRPEDDHRQEGRDPRRAASYSTTITGTRATPRTSELEPVRERLAVVEGARGTPAAAAGPRARAARTSLWKLSASVERRGQQQAEPQEAGRVLAQRRGVRADREAEQQQRRGAEHEHGHELRARAPLQQQVLAQGRAGSRSSRSAPARRLGRHLARRAAPDEPSLLEQRAPGRTAARPRSIRWVAMSDRGAPLRAARRARCRAERSRAGRARRRARRAAPARRPAAARARATGACASRRRSSPRGRRRATRARRGRAAALDGVAAQEARGDPEVLARGERLVQERLVGEQRHLAPHRVARRGGRRGRGRAPSP